MEQSELHQQKITILSRLIKESSLTLEEALLLLEQEEEETPTLAPTPTWMPPGYNAFPNHYTGTIRLSGSGLTTGGSLYPNTATTTAVVTNNITSNTTAELNT